MKRLCAIVLSLSAVHPNNALSCTQAVVDKRSSSLSLSLSLSLTLTLSPSVSLARQSRARVRRVFTQRCLRAAQMCAAATLNSPQRGCAHAQGRVCQCADLRRGGVHGPAGLLRGACAADGGRRHRHHLHLNAARPIQLLL